VDDVQQLHADTMPERFKTVGDLEPFVLDFRERILRDANGVVLIVEMDDEPVGYLYVTTLQRYENAYTYAQDSLFIDQIAVKPEFQNRGCGRALIEKVIEMAQSAHIRHIGLGTWAFNTGAHQFFAKQGFQIVYHRMELELEL
jgi:ribosomal protein S18 acetylase RimI-like enzyme